MLPHAVTIRPHTGQGTDGNTYGPPEVHRARVDNRPKIVTDNSGAQAVTRGTLILPPGAPVSLLSKLTLPDGTAGRILGVRTVSDAHRPIYVEVDLG